MDAIKSAYPSLQECATPAYPAVLREFQVENARHFYDAMVLAGMIYRTMSVRVSTPNLCSLYKSKPDLSTAGPEYVRLQTYVYTAHCIIKLTSTWNSVRTALVVELHTRGGLCTLDAIYTGQFKCKSLVHRWL